MKEADKMNQRERAIIDSVLEIIKKELKPARVILFGSRGKGVSAPSSDFDLAVDCAPVDDRLKRRVLEQIESASGLYGVDIVYLNEVENDFKEIILNTGKVIYGGRE